ncbi:copper chaperone PCu(A)C [Novosphingobium sp.]|uniref:copper chaperone PCu(A)C n=1 Tax=Novosphingobium sp. TaxID=1874826 RepID=UPI00261395D7|nr:copper chaperone PCu(A)C [Novosphingobium sp.]
MSRFAPLLLLAALTACGGGKGPATDPSGAAGTTAAADPAAKPGLALTGGRLVLPAVKGNPAAVYFTLVNGSDKPATLAAVDVAGAGMAMLHETTQADGHSTMAELKDPVIAPGASLELAPGGKHVMLDGVPADWKPGATAELTLVFADGDKLSAPLKVEAPGGD